jgi:hypothetical protein
MTKAQRLLGSREEQEQQLWPFSSFNQFRTWIVFQLMLLGRISARTTVEVGGKGQKI